ncbi:unnamed protein product, partial [Amoebophrya sp. A120]|eukprot:GSA120T00006798001.1
MSILHTQCSLVRCGTQLKILSQFARSSSLLMPTVVVHSFCCLLASPFWEAWVGAAGGFATSC